jgi:predicted PurR-regulated permease PerM
MNILVILPFLAASIIIIFNKPLLDYAEKKFVREGKSFNRQKAFMLLILAVIILIIKGLYAFYYMH